MINDEKASSQWSGMFYDQHGRSPTEAEFTEWYQKRNQAREMGASHTTSLDNTKLLGAPISEKPFNLDSLEEGADTFKAESKSHATLKANKGIFSDVTRGFKRDINIARNAAGKAQKTMTQEARANTLREAGRTEEDIAKILNKDLKLEQIGSKFLEEFGRGNKAMGAGKVLGYMLGGAMLVDMLNPFD